MPYLWHAAVQRHIAQIFVDFLLDVAEIGEIAITIQVPVVADGRLHNVILQYDLVRPIQIGVRPVVVVVRDAVRAAARLLVVDGKAARIAFAAVAFVVVHVVDGARGSGRRLIRRLVIGLVRCVGTMVAGGFAVRWTIVVATCGGSHTKQMSTKRGTVFVCQWKARIITTYDCVYG